MIKEMIEKKRLSIATIAALLLAVAPVFLQSTSSAWAWAIGEPEIPKHYQK